jgi:hypothetical protein
VVYSYTPSISKSLLQAALIPKIQSHTFQWPPQHLHTNGHYGSQTNHDQHPNLGFLPNLLAQLSWSQPLCAPGKLSYNPIIYLGSSSSHMPSLPSMGKDQEKTRSPASMAAPRPSLLFISLFPNLASTRLL